MRKITILILAVAAMVSCADNVDLGGGANHEGEDLFMQLQVAIPSTRSATDGEGDTNSDAVPDFEMGKDYENGIGRVTLELHNQADGTIVVADNVVPLAASSDTYVASFKSVDLKGGQSYVIYVYANASAQRDLNSIYSLSQDNVATSLAANGEFLMTNAAEAKVKTLPADLSRYTQASTPLDLGSHNVERAVARFDYKAAKTDNTYTVGGDSEGATTLNVQLTDLAIINMSRSFYYLRRTSADGTSANWSIGGVENATNYVVDSDWADKLAVVGNEADINAANFLYPMSANPSTWNFTPMSALTQDDNWTGTAAEGSHSLDDYKIWRYATENTIAGADRQVKGITTGVVFRGRLVATDAAPASLRDAMSAGERIYAFSNTLYGSWADVEAAANAGDDAALTAAYNLVVATPEAERTSQTYANAGFTGYSANADGEYEMLYYYWNRHNDNANQGVMGPMEFAVVRNNVYKLCVDDILRFGHPASPDDPDPDPELPDEPDEELDYYFTVSVRVLPWVVRVNHIEF